MIHRSSGVLLHISSLPGDYGIGSFGQEAVEFARQLHGCGFSFWQTLPFTTTDQYNSPYTSYSAFAGNPFFIDLPSLGRQGLLTDEELAEQQIYQNTIRLSIGTEHIDDILADLEAGFAAVRGK